MTKCECVIKNREENETMRDWLKRCMCMFHWMQTDYYLSKTNDDNRKIIKVDLLLDVDEIEMNRLFKGDNRNISQIILDTIEHIAFTDIPVKLILGQASK